MGVEFKSLAFWRKLRDALRCFFVAFSRPTILLVERQN